MITAEGLTFAYPGREPALDGLTLHVGEGERVAVLGPNGAGKTTLMLHLNGLLQGTGRVVIGGVELTRRTAPEVRRRVGLVFQDPDDQLFMPTVGEDVAFGPRNLGIDVEPAVEGALAAVGMTGFEHLPPHALSLGQRRRVAVATVLAMQPEVLVLDEPSANLDPRSRRELLAVLDAIERTLIVVTHDLPFAAQTCERAVILSAGRIVADGSCRDILADSELLAAYDLELPAGFAVEALA